MLVEKRRRPTAPCCSPGGSNALVLVSAIAADFEPLFVDGHSSAFEVHVVVGANCSFVLDTALGGMAGRPREMPTYQNC